MAWNSDYFNLSNWKITLPVDSEGGTSGTAVEVTSLYHYESEFFYDAPDGAMVFKAAYDGATTSGSSYARTELREMNGSDRAAWSLSQGGTMSATLKIDHMPIYKNGDQGRIVIGQIHGRNDELVRLYYEDGKLYFKNDQAGPDDKELAFYFKNAQGQEPNVSLGEVFTYRISAKGDSLSVKIYADGQIYTSDTKINDVWDSDQFYFKAGLYLGINESNGSGYGQVSFYGLDFGHTAGAGEAAWIAATEGTSPGGGGGQDTLPSGDGGDTGGEEDDVPTAETLLGDNANNTLQGGVQNEILKGYDGHDVLKGGAGDDFLWGNNDNDTLTGGLGTDTLKGGPGDDVFVFQNVTEGADIVMDYVKSQDKIDLSAIPLGVDNLNDALASSGIIRLQQSGENVLLKVNLAGKETLIATLLDTSVGEFAADNFILPLKNVVDNPLVLNGGTKADKLNGGSGNDTISGNGGNDELYGGGGYDVLKGGNGKDMFIYKSITDAGDVITDFRSGDKLAIKALAATFEGNVPSGISQLISKGYISYKQIDDNTHHVYADVDGSQGAAAKAHLVTLQTLSWFDSDADMFSLS